MTPFMILQVNCLQIITEYNNQSNGKTMNTLLLKKLEVGSDLIRINRISTLCIFVINICDSKNFLYMIFTDCYNSILPYCHWQHRVAFIINMLSNQIHSPCKNTKLKKYIICVLFLTEPTNLLKLIK